MNWDMIGATGEWAGAIAVVATLIYLSNQIKHARLAYWSAWIGSWEEYYLNPHRDEFRWKSVEYRIPRVLAGGSAAHIAKMILQ